MSIFLNNDSTKLVTFQQGAPPNYDGQLLPGSEVLYFIKDSCRLIIQEIVTDIYTIRLNIFRFFEGLSIDSISSREGLHCRVMLKQDLQHKINGSKTIFLKEGEFTMLWADKANCNCRFETDKEYTTFDIFYSPLLLKQVTSFFPELSNVIKKEQASLLVKNECWITPAMRDIIRQIMECPFDETTRQFYFDLKVREILYIMLEHSYKRVHSRYNFTAYETDCIVKAHAILLEDIRKKPLTIRMLSKTVAINEFKLKAGFRQFFGLSIFECLHEARMENARQLLLTTNKPIKEICVLSGYPRMTNFITAFRKKFGYTPGSLRRS